MTPFNIERASTLLAQNRANITRLSELPGLCRPSDERDAYAIQARLHEKLISAGYGGVAGWKIGCTTQVMQRFLNIDHPCAGGVFSSRVHQSGVTLSCADYCRVGVECEIVAVLGRDLAPRQEDYSRNDVAAAIDSFAAGIEIVDDRYEDFRALDAWTLAADDFFQTGCVLGDPVSLDDPDSLKDTAGHMTIDGIEVGRGSGRDILGHPLEALAWLANLKSREGAGLAAGSFVFLGSVVETKWPAAGQRVEVTIEGLGSVSATFTD